MNEPTIQLTGNVTGPVDLRFTPSGKPVARINVACNPRRLDSATNTWVDGTASFWACEVWGLAAENAADSLGKGDRVTVTGRVRSQVWTPSEGEHAGVEQRRLDVVVDELALSLKFKAAKPVTTTRTTTATAAADDGADVTPPF